MPKTITITVPDRPEDALALYREMFTPAFLAGVIEAALRQIAQAEPPQDAPKKKGA